MILDLIGFPGVGKTHLVNHFIHNYVGTKAKHKKLSKYYKYRLILIFNIFLIPIFYYKIISVIINSTTQKRSLFSIIFYIKNSFELILNPNTRKKDFIPSILYLLSSSLVDRFFIKISDSKKCNLLFGEGVYQKSIGLFIRLPEKIRKIVIIEYLKIIKTYSNPLFIDIDNKFIYTKNLVSRKRGPSAFIRWSPFKDFRSSWLWMDELMNEFQDILKNYIFHDKNILLISNHYDSSTEKKFNSILSEFCCNEKIIIVD